MFAVGPGPLTFCYFYSFFYELCAASALFQCIYCIILQHHRHLFYSAESVATARYSAARLSL